MNVWVNFTFIRILQNREGTIFHGIRRNCDLKQVAYPRSHTTHQVIEITQLSSSFLSFFFFNLKGDDGYLAFFSSFSKCLQWLSVTQAKVRSQKFNEDLPCRRQEFSAPCLPSGSQWKVALKGKQDLTQALQCGMQAGRVAFIPCVTNACTSRTPNKSHPGCAQDIDVRIPPFIYQNL